ncbi:hypothetical protein PGT21_031444 [Puccinia graminis f. sp. tritici]|uniref:Uncharacterized protein n=1 Tax=Puccinia graminis f. sp. tritici TaxID=56615 RepID=A0A5B0P2B7_PUCGR|nr:hypothetical protein PGTUg99_010421 [Puccinia graminis f. sp. tritici]KAA1094854.1 hypothetical protein PGT21_031444 [Puccinia graminis f. sp. tritici]
MRLEEWNWMMTKQLGSSKRALLRHEMRRYCAHNQHIHRQCDAASLVSQTDSRSLESASRSRCYSGEIRKGNRRDSSPPATIRLKDNVKEIQPGKTFLKHDNCTALSSLMCKSLVSGGGTPSRRKPSKWDGVPPPKIEAHHQLENDCKLH